MQRSLPDGADAGTKEHLIKDGLPIVVSGGSFIFPWVLHQPSRKGATKLVGDVRGGCHGRCVAFEMEVATITKFHALFCKE